MGIWGSFKKACLEIFSDDVAPIVCTHCGWYDVSSSEPAITVCNNCGAKNEIYHIGTMPVCGNCHSHSYHLECPRCGRKINK